MFMPWPDRYCRRILQILTSWHDMCSDGGLLIMGKAAQEKAKFRWYDTTRYEVSNKVSEAGRSHEVRGLMDCSMIAGPLVLRQPRLRTSTASACGTKSCSTRLRSCKQQLCALCA